MLYTCLTPIRTASSDRQARSVLIDSAMSLAVYTVSAVALANALQVGLKRDLLPTTSLPSCMLRLLAA